MKGKERGMGLLRSHGAALGLLLSATLAAGQGPDQPAGDREPLFHLETGGPTSLVTALAFSPDGGTLYEAGWDKVVRVGGGKGRKGPSPSMPRPPTGCRSAPASTAPSMRWPCHRTGPGWRSPATGSSATARVSAGSG